MPLAKSLSDTRKILSDLLVEDLPTALKALKELLPEDSEKNGLVVALQARLQLLNKDKIRGVIDAEEYAKRLAGISSDFQDMLEELEEIDFEPPVKSEKKSDGSTSRKGSALYRIPHKMPISKPSLCTIRIAVEEDAILEDIVLDDDVHLRERVEISERMSAELIDAGDQAFDILPLNAAHQSVQESGYTQWLFRVTPKKAGEHELMVKISILEFDQNTKEYLPREISIMETVSIVTEAPAPAELEEAPFKAAGQAFVVGSGSAAQPATGKKTNKGLRGLAFSLAFLIFGGSVTWANTPPEYRDYLLAKGIAAISGSPESLDNYMQTYRNNPKARTYLLSACIQKAELSGLPADGRTCNLEFGEIPVDTARVRELTSVKSITDQPEEEKVRQYLEDFPDAELLPQVKQVIDSLPEASTDLFSGIEAAYLRSLKLKIYPQKVKAFLFDFPQSPRLCEVAEMVVAHPQVLEVVRPELEIALKLRLESTSDPAEVNCLQEIFKKIRKMGKGSVPKTPENPAPGELPNSNPTKPIISSQPNNHKPEVTEAPVFRQDNMILIDGGIFQMGNNYMDTDEKPAHSVTLNSFYLSRFELTVREYLVFCKETNDHYPKYGSEKANIVATNADNFAERFGQYLDEHPNDPITGISWYDAQAYCKWLSQKTGQKYRLPTEAEWEYSARGGKWGSSFTYSGGDKIGEVAWYGNNSGGEPHSVGEKDKNHVGLFDMSGNVMEWCSDRHGPYPADSQTNPKGTKTGPFRVVRGGARNSPARLCRVEARYFDLPTHFRQNLGFRVARSK